MQETRQVRKLKKDTDTCRDCWTKRFRQELYNLWNNSTDHRKFTLSEFITAEFKMREKMVAKLRAEATDIYDEIAEIKAFAGDLYMDPTAIPTDET